MDNNRAKTRYNKKIFYYQNIVHYIKNNNQDVTKTKTETKSFYPKIIQEASKQYTIAGEIHWKKHFTNYQPFTEYGKIHLNRMLNHPLTTFTIDYYITQLKQITQILRRQQPKL